LAGFDPVDLLKQGAAGSDTGDMAGTLFDPPSIEVLTKLFPRFHIHRLIGRGGMGAVYEVRQPELDRVVALKILPHEIGGRPGFSERFAREAKALAKLNHPGIVTLHEFGQVEGLHFILMEYVDGANLRDLLEHGRISPREALAIVPQICDALQYAHDHGIIHRDIKPENILLDRLGRVKVADFGLAKLAVAGDIPSGITAAVGSTHFTEMGKIMGTPAYMAPEQLSSPGEVDHRADIYALGVVFYQMLTGHLPDKALKAPSEKVRIDVRLDEVVMRALQAKPEMRFQQASLMKTEVEGLHAVPSMRAPVVNQWNLDYRSKASLFGLPLLHVTSGADPETGRERIAKGIIAIGGRARGVIAFGGVATGGIAMGGVAIGVISLGGLATGLFAFGGMSVGLIGAFGGMALAPVAIGGGALGYYSFGGGAFGMHALGGNADDPAAREFFQPWGPVMLAHVGWATSLMLALMFFVSFGVPMWIQRNLVQDGEARRQARKQGIVMAALIVMPAFIFAVTRFTAKQASVETVSPVTSNVQELPTKGPLPGKITLRFLNGGKVEMNGETLDDKEWSLKMAGWIARKGDTPVVIDVLPSTSAKEIQEIMNRCGILGATNIRFDQRSNESLPQRHTEPTVEPKEHGVQQQPQAAEASLWLGKIDARDYRRSYDDLPSIVRNTATLEQWEASMKIAREPLGGLVGRKPLKMEDRKMLPGMPDGEYRIWQFESNFEKKEKAVETVIMGKISGEWKPLGYFIR